MKTVHDTTIAAKESLFQLDINGNGMIDHDHGTMPMPTDPVCCDPVDPVMPPMDDHDGHDGHDDMPMDDHDGHDHMAPPASSGEFIDIDMGHSMTRITTLTIMSWLEAAQPSQRPWTHTTTCVHSLAFQRLLMTLVNGRLLSNLQTMLSPGNDIKSVGLWYAMQGAKVGWIAQDKYDPQILADISERLLGDQLTS